MSSKSKQIRCTVSGCDTILTTTFNLNRHMKRLHPGLTNRDDSKLTDEESVVPKQSGASGNDTSMVRRVIAVKSTDVITTEQLITAGAEILASGPGATIDLLVKKLMSSPLGLPPDIARAAAISGRVVACGIAAMKDDAASAHKCRPNSVMSQSLQATINSWAEEPEWGYEQQRKRTRSSSNEDDQSDSDQRPSTRAGLSESSSSSDEEGGVPPRADKPVASGSAKENAEPVAAVAEHVKSAELPASQDSNNNAELETDRMTAARLQKELDEMKTTVHSLQMSMSQEKEKKKKKKKKARREEANKEKLYESGSDMSGHEQRHNLPKFVDLNDPKPRTQTDYDSEPNQRTASSAARLGGVSTATSRQPAYTEVTPRVFVYDPRRKDEWEVCPSPLTKVLLIGDSNMKLARDLPKDWEIHALCGGRFHHVTTILRQLQLSSCLRCIIVQVGINHNEDLDEIRRDEAEDMLRELRRLEVRSLYVGVSIPSGLSNESTATLEALNTDMFKYFAASYVYELDPKEVKIDPADPYGVHYTGSTVDRIIDSVVRRVAALKLLKPPEREAESRGGAERPYHAASLAHRSQSGDRYERRDDRHPMQRGYYNQY